MERTLCETCPLQAEEHPGQLAGGELVVKVERNVSPISRTFGGPKQVVNICRQARRYKECRTSTGTIDNSSQASDDDFWGFSEIVV